MLGKPGRPEVVKREWYRKMHGNRLHKEFAYLGDSSEWVFFDVGVFLDALAAPSENFCFPTAVLSWVGDHSARPPEGGLFQRAPVKWMLGKPGRI